MVNTDVSDFAKAQGILGYRDAVRPCQMCNRLTNIVWETNVGGITACSVECAQAYAGEMS